MKVTPLSRGSRNFEVIYPQGKPVVGDVRVTAEAVAAKIMTELADMIGEDCPMTVFDLANRRVQERIVSVFQIGNGGKIALRKGASKKTFDEVVASITHDVVSTLAAYREARALIHSIMKANVSKVCFDDTSPQAEAEVMLEHMGISEDDPTYATMRAKLTAAVIERRKHGTH